MSDGVEDRRILMLVPHEPKLDPRIEWVTRLCRELARTHVVGAAWSTSEPIVEYDGVVSVERSLVMQNAAPLVIRALPLANRFGAHPSSVAFAERHGVPPGGLAGRMRHQAGAFRRLIANWASFALLITALYRKGRSVGVAPKVIVAHDIYALIPAVLLKRRWGSRLLYDSHEYTPQGDLLAPRWQQRLTRMVERRFIRRADRVVTVSPPLARQLERDYRIRNVLSVPNAEPAASALSAIAERTGTRQVQFLLQGQAAPGRGFERLFEFWETLETDAAHLVVRCPDGEYPRELRDKFSALFASGRASWLPAVSESELVTAAATADVGVIPYLGPNLNHVYACPNKLSQYMAAGLAILSTNLEYVSAILAEYRCGAVYDAADAGSFASAIERLVHDRAELDAMRRRAQEAARTTYNWEHVSAPYRDALVELLTASP